MFQPEVKLTFVQRYCAPANGWDVFVDIDPSERGRTGGKRIKPESVIRETQMRENAVEVEKTLLDIGVHVGKRRFSWLTLFRKSVPTVTGDRDIIAVHRDQHKLLVVEVEGDSTGQPEQKLYKAIGQIVMARSECSLPSFAAAFVVAVHGHEMRDHLKRATVLEEIGICGLHLGRNSKEDELVLRPEDSWFVKAWMPDKAVASQPTDNFGDTARPC